MSQMKKEMTKEITNKETADFLRQQDNFLIINHRRPDGDAVGCAVALCLGLRAMGKQAKLWKNPQTTERYLPYVSGLETETEEAGMILVSVDMATEGLLPLNGEHFAGRIQLSIDHHPSNEGYARLSNVQPKAAACGEVILAILEQLLDTVTVPMAEALYLAVSTDTGCFQYSNVTPDTLRTAARLKELGADTYSINKVMFGTKTIARLRLEAALTESAAFYAGGLVGLCVLTYETMDKLGATEDDADDISGFPRSIQGVKIGVMLRNLREGGSKISLRTEGGYDASAICGLLGGGGHKAAAGATLDCGIEEAKEKILGAIAQSGVVLK
jgi:phosphoesterase RecJ-like protein